MATEKFQLTEVLPQKYTLLQKKVYTLFSSEYS